MLQTFNTKLSNKTKLTNSVYLLRFDLIEPKEINFQAGQYVVLQVPKDGEYLSRLYSIASSPNINNSFELIIGFIPGGVASEYLNKLNIGDNIMFKGIAGMFTPKTDQENQKNLAFFVTGTGIAPARSILKTILNTTNYSLLTTHYYLFWGLPFLSDVYLLDELKRLSQKNPNFQFCICLSREMDLNQVSEQDRQYFGLGRINICFDKFIKNNNNQQFINSSKYYICGSREVTDSLKSYLLEKGVKTENICFEKF